MAISARRVEADDSDGVLKEISEQTPGIDVVPQGIDYKALFAEEAFMAEKVTIMLQPTEDESEVGLPVGVNGKRVYLVPGRIQQIPRTHVAQLVKARPDRITHRYDDYHEREDRLNIMRRQSKSLYNFDVLEDTPKGVAWLRDLRKHYFQK